MKKYFLLTLILTFSVSIVMATELHVGPGQPYETIQSAVDVANSYDEIIIHPFTYEENVNLDNFQEGYLTLRSTNPQDPNIVETTIVNPANPNIPTFLRTTSPEDSFTSITISGLTISDGGTAIRIYDIFWPTYLFINYCIIENNYYGIMSESFHPINVDYSILRDNSITGIISTHNWAANRQCIVISNSLISSNGSGLGTDLDMIVENCTIVDNAYTGISGGYGTSTIKSSIIYGNNTQINNGQGTVNVSYSDVEDGYIGTGNINADPLFFDHLNDNYNLTQLSPCIDAGDPFLPLDPDDTVTDMGCYYFHHDYDIKRFEEGIQWVSFPYLTQQGTSNGEIFEQAYYENGDPGLLQLTSIGDPTINDFDIIYGHRNGNDIEIDYYSGDFIDDDFDNMLFRHEGYKVKVTDGGDPTVLIVDGDRLGSYTLDMPDLENFWLGYYIPYPQNIEDAFGDDFGDVNRVWAEDWYYDALYIQRGGDPNQLSSNSTKGKTMEYGKMYIVQMYRDVYDFSWNGSTTVEEPTKKTTPENFSYIEKIDYEVIDVVNIPSNITEIGVFEDEICVGAIAVEDTCAQILVYSDNANRDPIPFTFEIVTGRGFSTPTKDYLVLNQMTGEFEPSVIISGRQGYSAIKFGEQEEPENIISRPVLNGNYPNPFNPTTTISFSLPTEQDIELTIYNIKGQKIKTIYSGTADVGDHSIIWEGKDNSDKQVSSGIYFYKLTTNNKELTRKMLMMK